jgi:hypothetical protein
MRWPSGECRAGTAPRFGRGPIRLTPASEVDIFDFLAGLVNPIGHGSGCDMRRHDDGRMEQMRGEPVLAPDIVPCAEGKDDYGSCEQSNQSFNSLHTMNLDRFGRGFVRGISGRFADCQSAIRQTDCCFVENIGSCAIIWPPLSPHPDPLPWEREQEADVQLSGKRHWLRPPPACNGFYRATNCLRYGPQIACLRN